MSKPADSALDATAFILPLILFLVIASFYPAFSTFDAGSGEPATPGAANLYVSLVAAQVLIAGSLIGYFHAVYIRHFPLRCSLLSIVVGIVGVVLWVGLCELHIERTILESIGLKSWTNVRPAFNPFESLPDTSFRNLFLVLRFTLMALMVPVVEELFLRGWLVRWMEDPNWESIGLKSLSWGALLTPSVYGVITHPTEAIAAFVWFGLVSWLMWRTGNLWDCIVAHAVTNLLLAIYVVQYSAWHLW